MIRFLFAIIEIGFSTGYVLFIFCVKVGFHLASERSRLAQERQLEVCEILPDVISQVYILHHLITIPFLDHVLTGCSLCAPVRVSLRDALETSNS